MANMRIVSKIFVYERVGRFSMSNKQTALEKYLSNAVFLCASASLREIILFPKSSDRAMRRHSGRFLNNNS